MARGHAGSADRLPGQIQEAVARFGATVAPLLHAKVGQSEANLTSAVETLLCDVAKILGLDMLAHREATDKSLGVRPDLAIDVAGARVGIVELKANGMGVPGPSRWDKPRDRGILAETDSVMYVGMWPSETNAAYTPPVIFLLPARGDPSASAAGMTLVDTCTTSGSTSPRLMCRTPTITSAPSGIASRRAVSASAG